MPRRRLRAGRLPGAVGSMSYAFDLVLSMPLVIVAGGRPTGLLGRTALGNPPGSGRGPGKIPDVIDGPRHGWRYGNDARSVRIAERGSERTPDPGPLIGASCVAPSTDNEFKRRRRTALRRSASSHSSRDCAVGALTRAISAGMIALLYVSQSARPAADRANSRRLRLWNVVLSTSRSACF